MIRATVVFGLVLPAILAPGTEGRTQPQAGTDVENASPTRWLSRLVTAFEIEQVPDRVAHDLIRWRFAMRDLARGAVDRLADLAHASGFLLPDLTILTTFPLPTSSTSWATSGFGWRDDPMRRRPKFHSGADVRAKPGTPVYAAGDGIVMFAGRQGGYGNLVKVDHGGGVITRYAHLRQIHTKIGEPLTGGQQLGQVGSTGRATGPHLHFEVRLDGNPVDPTMALTVGELQRDAPAAGRVAAFALSPELQTREVSDLDPPRSKTKAKANATGASRPARPGYVKRARPTS